MLIKDIYYTLLKDYNAGKITDSGLVDYLNSVTTSIKEPQFDINQLCISSPVDLIKYHMIETAGLVEEVQLLFESIKYMNMHRTKLYINPYTTPQFAPSNGCIDFFFYKKQLQDGSIEWSIPIISVQDFVSSLDNDYTLKFKLLLLNCILAPTNLPSLLSIYIKTGEHSIEFSKNDYLLLRFGVLTDEQVEASNGAYSRESSIILGTESSSEFSFNSNVTGLTMPINELLQYLGG